MIISICNQKGGVAKTTSTINIASCLSELGKKVLVIDLDPQINLTKGVGIENVDKSVYEILIDEKLKCKDVIINTSFNFDIIPSKLRLANAEVELSNMIDREFLLKDKLEEVEKDYDYILIDCNPALGFLTLNALVSCDKIIIPMETAAFSLDGLDTLKDLIKRIKKRLNPNIDIMGILLTRADKRTNLSNLFKNELESIFGKKLFNTIIHTNIELGKAQMENKPINFYNKKCNGYIEYMKLSKEILENE